jgi:glyoxylase-like metal-dependent hydrolase (beta-lactamase superfamily II)
VAEAEGIRVAPEFFLDGITRHDLQAIRHRLPTGCIDAATDEVIMTLQSWLVRTPHHVVLIDTCGGNHKQRPETPMLHQLETPWLDRLREKGVNPEQVDFVMCTHLHADHVGWNTRLIDGRWVPTFPNAQYIFSRREYEHWNPAMGDAKAWGQQGVFEDSVLPCVEAGLATLVDAGYTVDDALHVESAPGHSRGNTLIRATSSGKSALFTGDCIHTPIQIALPNVCTRVCEDHTAARATRRRILNESAEHGHLIIPAHFPAPYLGRVTAANDTFNYHPGLL